MHVITHVSRDLRDFTLNHSVSIKITRKSISCSKVNYVNWWLLSKNFAKFASNSRRNIAMMKIMSFLERNIFNKNSTDVFSLETVSERSIARLETKTGTGIAHSPGLFAIDLFRSGLEKNMRLPNETHMDGLDVRTRVAWIIPRFGRIFNIATRVGTNELNLSPRFYWNYSSRQKMFQQTTFKAITFITFFLQLSSVLSTDRLVVRKTTHLRKFGKIARGRWESTIDREPCKTPYPRHPRGQGSRDAARPFWKPARCFGTHRPCSGRWSHCNKKRRNETT